MSMVGFPLLLIPLAIFNIIVFLMPGVTMTEPIFTVPLLSGAAWPVTLSDMLLALGIVLLLSEVIKGARPGAKYLTDHLLSLVVFGGAAAEFLLLPRFASSTFFLLALLAMVDFFSGVALRTRRGAGAAAKTSRPVGRTVGPVVAPEPRFDPAPVRSPAPASVTEPAAPERIEPAAPVHVEPVAPTRIEPVAPVHVEPPVAHDEVAPASAIASPEVTSPGLQPSHDTSPPPDAPPR